MSLSRKSLPTFLPFALLALARLAAPARADEATAAGVKGEMLYWIEDAEKKLTELAAATTEANYSWRPGKDVRSTGEVFMHVASANYGLPSIAGVKPPAGFQPGTYEKSLTRKADIEKALKDSFAHAKKALAAASEADLNKPVDLFGSKTTFRGAYMLVLAHAHEHLGQSIAYARSNEVAPPWTARRQAQREAMKKDGAKKP